MLSNYLRSLIAAVLFAVPLSAAKDSVADLPKRALEKSQITASGSTPFHLRARVFEATNPKNDGYNADIDEYWLAPDKWRRTVKTAAFSETLTVNGDKVSEDLTGDYYPNWLRTIVNAIFDPGQALQAVDMSKSSDNPVIGGTKFCRRFAYRAGVPPVGNNVFSTVCFDRDLLDSIVRPGYEVEYQGYKKFAGRLVAHKIREDIESGTEVGADIEELTELNPSAYSIPSIEQLHPPLRTITVSEETVRSLLMTKPELNWPMVRGGKPVGVLSIYVCIDRTGRVRETYPLNSDHPVMSDAARQQVMTWQFKPAASGGVLVQVESILTFAYQTKIDPKGL